MTHKLDFCSKSHKGLIEISNNPSLPLNVFQENFGIVEKFRDFDEMFVPPPQMRINMQNVIQMEWQIQYFHLIAPKNVVWGAICGALHLGENELFHFECESPRRRCSVFSKRLYSENIKRENWLLLI